MNHPHRVVSVDVLRGVSLLGILVMNIQSFAMPHAAYLNPSVFGSLEGLDGVAWSLGRLFFDFKFISLFSTLFGASLVLAGDATNQRRRLGWLVAIGLLHGWLVWYGDVLFTYGVVGLVLLPARQWPLRRLVAVGVTLLVASPLLVAAGWLFFDSLPVLLLDDVRAHYDASSVASELEVFRSGWWAQLPTRASIAFDNQVTGTLLESGWRAAGCMLLGMATVRSGAFEGRLRAPRVWTSLFVLGLVFSAAALWLQWSSGFELRTWFLAQALHELGSIGVAVGIGASVVWLALRFPASFPTVAIGRLGKVAFTAYLMHSVVGTLVFGGHGLGLFGTWSRTALFVTPFAVWLVQLGLAWWWTSRFTTGPLEALWRGLSKGTFTLGRVERAG